MVWQYAKALESSRIYWMEKQTTTDKRVKILHDDRHPKDDEIYSLSEPLDYLG